MACGDLGMVVKVGTVGGVLWVVEGGRDEEWGCL